MTIISAFPISDDEKRAYELHALEKFKAVNVMGMHIRAIPDSDDVEITYDLEGCQFERIRRITGYLVGTLDRFNDGKRAEVNDRLKHNLKEE